MRRLTLARESLVDLTPDDLETIVVAGYSLLACLPSNPTSRACTLV